MKQTTISCKSLLIFSVMVGIQTRSPNPALPTFNLKYALLFYVMFNNKRKKICIIFI